MAHNSYTMSTRGLPDMYTLGCTYQANHLCPWYNYNIYIYIYMCVTVHGKTGLVRTWG